MQTLSFSDILQKKVIGVEDLQHQLKNILNKLPKEGEIVITQRGKPKGVLIDMAYYLEWEELQEQIADSDPKLVKEINDALKDAKAGNVVDADTVFKELGI